MVHELLALWHSPVSPTAAPPATASPGTGGPHLKGRILLLGVPRVLVGGTQLGSFALEERLSLGTLLLRHVEQVGLRVGPGQAAKLVCKGGSGTCHSVPPGPPIPQHPPAIPQLLTIVVDAAVLVQRCQVDALHLAVLIPDLGAEMPGRPRATAWIQPPAPAPSSPPGTASPSPSPCRGPCAGQPSVPRWGTPGSVACG